MAKQIKATDIFESEDIFRGIRQSAEQAIDTLGKFKLELKQTADELKKTIGGATVGDTKSINELITATQKANDVKEKTIKIDQEQEKLRKLAIQSEREELKLKKDLENQAIREQKTKDKELKQAQQQESIYAQTSKRLNDLRKAYKDLAIQNRENTAEGQKLIAEITELDTKLKKVDATVGQHQRNVGNYEGATMSLRAELRMLTQELANMDTADPRFASMAQRAGELRDSMQDAQGVIKATAGTAVENLAGSMVRVGQVGVAAFQGVQSAMVLAGVENEQLMKAMVQLQAVAGLSDALQTLGGLGDMLTEIRAGFTAAAQKLGILVVVKEADVVATNAQTTATVAQEAATEGAAVATGVLGKSMKALPIIAIVAALASLVYMVYDYISSSSKAEEATKKRAEAERRANEETKKATEFVAKESSEFVGLIMQLKSTNEGSKERTKLMNQINSQYGTTLKNLKNETAFQAQLNQAVADYIEYSKAKFKFQQYDDARERNLALQQKATINYNKELASLNKELLSPDAQRAYNKALKEGVIDAQFLNEQYRDRNIQESLEYKRLVQLKKTHDDYNNTISDANKRLENYGLQQLKLKDVTGKYNVTAKESNDTKKETIKINEDLKKSLEDLQKQFQSDTFTQQALLVIERERTAQRLKDEFKVSTDLKNRDAQLKEALLLNEQEYQRKLKALNEANDIVKAETDVNKLRLQIANASGLQLIALRVQLREAELNLLKQQEENELLNAGNNADLKLKIESDYAIKRQQINEEYAFKSIEEENKTEEKRIEIQKLSAEKRNEWAKFATDYFIKMSDERIAQLDKEIAAAEKQQDTLRELAANGNINARESLAENQRIIDEANRKKEQQERRKQMIELVSGVYQTYNQKVAANAKNPLMETIRDTVLLQQFANTLLGNMPTFFDGTENTGKHGEGVDGKGGFHAILHPNERVVPKSLNEKIGSLSNEQLAKVAQEYQNGKLITGTQPMSAIDLSLLVNEMKDLKDVIRNKPETNIELGEITSSVMEIVKTTKQGNTLKTNRFKIRK
jgi:hypothetical protein